MSQGPTIRASSSYLYIPQRDGWIRQDPGPRDPLHGEPSDLRGCQINLSLTLVFNISSLLGNTNRFKGNIHLGFHILAGIKQGRNCVMRLSRAAFFYLFVSTLDAAPCGRFWPTDSLSFQNPLFQPNGWQENLCKFSVHAPVAKTSAAL